MGKEIFTMSFMITRLRVLREAAEALKEIIFQGFREFKGGSPYNKARVPIYIKFTQNPTHTRPDYSANPLRWMKIDVLEKEFKSVENTYP